MKLKKKKKIILLCLVTAFITLEVLLRILYADKLDVAFRPAVYRSLPVVNYGYVPDTCFTLSGKNYYINKQGFIGNDFEEKSVDTFRIAVVGTSVVAGSINLREYYSFCPMLQENFTKNNINVQIINCGIDGGDRSLEVLKSINYQIINFNPDMILMEYVLPFSTWNLIRENYRGYIIGYPAFDKTGPEYTKQIVDNLHKFKPYFDVLYHSYVVRSIFSLYTKTSNSHFSWYITLYETKIFVYGNWAPIDFTLEESADMIHEVKNKLNKLNIQFFLFTPNRDDSLIQTAKKFKLPLISLNTKFSENDYPPEEGHWNMNGCQKVADSFYETLTKYDLIPKQYYDRLK